MISSDKRIVDRLDSSCQCLIYINNKEYKGGFVDISEGGVRIKVIGLGSDCELKNGDMIKAIFIDDDEVTSIKVSVVWTKKENEEETYIGGRVLNYDEFEAYVTSKRVNLYWDEMKK